MADKWCINSCLRGVSKSPLEYEDCTESCFAGRYLKPVIGFFLFFFFVKEKENYNNIICFVITFEGLSLCYE